MSRNGFQILLFTLVGFSLAAAQPLTRPYAREFRPGGVWHDTDGKPIYAHGGGVLFHEGLYYWYGEVKEGRTYLPAVNQKWGGTRGLAGGVSCYSSTNLYTWKNKGDCPPKPEIPPDMEDGEKCLDLAGKMKIGGWN